MHTTRAVGARSGEASNHGSMSPWTIRNTCFAWGVDFKRGVEVRVPVSNVDLVPTILALKGIRAGASHDGRVLSEALLGGPDEEQIPVETRILTTQAHGGHYRAAIQISAVAHQRYIDKVGACASSRFRIHELGVDAEPAGYPPAEQRRGQMTPGCSSPVTGPSDLAAAVD